MGRSTKESALSERSQQFPYVAVVLLGKHFGGGQQHCLPAGVHDLQHGPQGDQGFTGADIALQ